MYLPDLIGISILLLPGILLCERVYDKIQASHCCKSLKEDSEENVICDILTCDKRISPSFIPSLQYKTLRTERAKNALKEITPLVNQNLEVGNRHFLVPISDSDEHIMEVVRRLIISHLNEDGYEVDCNIRDQSDGTYAFEICIV